MMSALSLFHISDADFIENATLVTVPAGSHSYIVPELFTIVDDNVNEPQQSFAIIAEIGEDVPENISCFQTEIGSSHCYGRHGTTAIGISDNDHKYGTFYFNTWRY